MEKGTFSDPKCSLCKPTHMVVFVDRTERLSREQLEGMLAELELIVDPWAVWERQHSDQTL